MSQPSADRNLLFGILALQMDFITREQLIAAMKGWVFDKKRSLGEILVSQKALDREHCILLDALVTQHIARHDNQPEKSLTAVRGYDEVRRDLADIADEEVQKSLGHGASATDLIPADPFATVMPDAAPARSRTELAAPSDPYATVIPEDERSRSRTASGHGSGGGGVLRPETGAGGGSRFRVVRPHARGGLGEVFVAQDEELNREVALKEIQDRAADNPESRVRFLLEAEITGGLEHPGIVPVYGLGTYPDGRPYYAMRFIRGESLKDAIDRFHNAAKVGMDPGQYALELRALLRRFVDVCNAIAYAHSRGVIHRDLKPGNIMLGKFGETLVVDWGLAKPLGEPLEPGQSVPAGEGSLIPSSMSVASKTILGAAVGTPQYMSPEQASGSVDQLSPASDVYSLGATLYCILTGQTPFTDPEISVVLQRVKRGDFKKPSLLCPDVPRPLEAICIKAMAIMPADRYHSASLLANDIDHWLADEPVSAWPEPWTVRARRWIGRHATLVAGVASAVVVALVGLILATVLLTAANERERKAKELAETQRQKAEANFKLARQAVDTYHTRVSENDLLKEPGMQPLRRKLLEAASQFYQKFIQDRAGDPNVQGELGKATFRLAQIVGEIESNPKAIELHEKAARIFEALPPAKDGDDFQVDQAACYHHLGRLYRLTGNLEKSSEYYTRASKAWTALADAKPREIRILEGQARTQMGLGNAHMVDRKLEHARGLYEQSLGTWNELLRTHPEMMEYEREIAVNHSNLAQIYQAIAGKDQQAKDSLRAAQALQKKLADSAPNIGKYHNDLAASSYLLARSLMASPETAAEAKSFLVEATERWQMLTQQHPAVVVYHVRLAEAYMDLANAYLNERDWPEAEGAAQKAVAIQRKLADRHKDDSTYQSTLARGLVMVADVCSSDPKADREKDAVAAYTEAVKIQEKLASAPGAPPHFRRDVARTYQSVGLMHERRQRDEKATDAYQNALRWWEKLVKEYPEEQEYAVGLSSTFLGMGNVTKLVGDLKKADGWYTQAVASIDVNKLRSTNAPQAKNALCSAYWMRAETRTQLKQGDAALGDWDQALALARPGQKPAIQLPRAAALARTGKYREAVEEIRPLVGKAKAGESLYRFAAVFAVAADAAKDRTDLADEYADQAIRLLNAAQEGKYFNSGANQAKLQNDPDLQALRGRPAFQKLLDGLKLQ